MLVKAGSKQARSDERFFFGVAVVVALIFGAGFVFLMLALNHREKTPHVPVPSGDAVALAPDHSRQLVDFSLTDRSGRTVTRSDLAGKFVVVDFLFTSCSLTCPVVNGHMAEIQKLTAGQPDVELLSLTVDPRDDTTEVLANYGRQFGADTNRWLLVTGDRDDLHHLIATSFLSQDETDPFTYMPGNFSHTERIAVVDSRGNVRAYFDGLAYNVATAVVDQIARLRQ
jgi:cytochrome oxidase Cu insertion factor (SCO1/SenC/PrrC family)